MLGLIRTVRGVAVAAFLVLALVFVVLLVGCGGSVTSEQRETAVKERARTFDTAQKAVPTPKLSNFPLRRALVEFTERQDLIDHPWYVYVLAQTGNVIGYYVARTVPVNACNFLSSTEDLWTGASGASQVLTAPSLDGIFYGGGGAAAGCDAWFFFDAATNALIQIRGVHWFSSDQPLRLDAEPIRVGR